jgi:ribonuclease Z
MARIKQAYSPLLIAALFAGAGGYMLGCTPPKPEAESQAPAEQPDAAGDSEQAAQPDQAQADPGTASKYSPVKARARDFYAPNTEDLGPDEMRLIACGTGMPTARPKQAASCWLLELGNGDKFIFDIGTGSAERISAFQIPYNYLDKVFLSHLHTDHFGDLDALFVGGALAGRQKPLRVWGPSGETPERGTKYALDHLRKALTWDLDGRQGLTDPRGYHFDVTEFDYMGMNEVIYQENGVTIRSFPAIHSLDGPVSFVVEWNGFKFVFGGDTYPNKWFMKYAQDADIVIHECFLTPDTLVKWYGMSPGQSLLVGTQVHTAPQAFGKVMSTLKPRHAIAYHFLNEVATRYAIYSGLRETYDGPVSMAADNMVWNITKEKIVERMTVSPDQAWAVPGPTPPPAPPTEGVPDPMTDFIKAGRWDGVNAALAPVVEDFKKEHPDAFKK